MWELTKEIINLPLGCLQGGEQPREKHAPLAFQSHSLCRIEKIFSELMTSDRNMKVSREGSKCRTSYQPQYLAS